MYGWRKFKSSRMAWLHENLFSWFWGIGELPPTSKKCILCVQMHCLPISEMSNVGADIAKKSVI